MATFGRHDGVMTTDHTNTSFTSASAGGPGTVEPNDPRHGLAAAITAAGKVIGQASQLGADRLCGPTPCSDYTVEQLLEHMLFVARRVAHIGNGGHFADTPADHAGGDWAAEFTTRAEAVHEAWADPAKLGQTYAVPWGEMPGAALMLTYTAEFAAHTNDLAQAIGAEVEVDDDALAGAAEAVRFIPAEGRDDPGIPFGPVVEAPANATNLEQIVTWTGRSLTWSPPPSS